jgi:hypothetical protein
MLEAAPKMLLLKCQSHVAELLPTRRMLKSRAAAEALNACRRIAANVYAATELNC